MLFTEWMDENWKDTSIDPPSLNAQLALHFLREYLVGDEFLSEVPITEEQANVLIVERILDKYSSKYWKESSRRGKN